MNQCLVCNPMPLGSGLHLYKGYFDLPISRILGLVTLLLHEKNKFDPQTSMMLRPPPAATVVG